MAFRAFGAAVRFLGLALGAGALSASCGLLYDYSDYSRATSGDGGGSTTSSVATGTGGGTSTTGTTAASNSAASSGASSTSTGCVPTPCGSDDCGIHDDGCLGMVECGPCTDQGGCGHTGVCNAGTGKCEFYPTNTQCKKTCDDTGAGSVTQWTCSGQGSCVAGTPTSCDGYACSTNTGCLTGLCANNNAFCSADYACFGAACSPKSGPMGFCIRDDECVSDSCNVATEQCN